MIAMALKRCSYSRTKKCGAARHTLRGVAAEEEVQPSLVQFAQRTGDPLPAVSSRLSAAMSGSEKS
jgi:hypothetical protein